MSEQIIMGMCGRKSSGKNTLANYTLGLILKSKKIVHNGFAITDEGWLYVEDIYGDKAFGGVLDLNNPNPDIQSFLSDEVYPYVKLYSFADSLKEFAINVLGLSYEQCYGVDAEKNSPTKITWESFPVPNQNSGFMTAREVLQQFGTGICRRMVTNCWAAACLRKIKKEKSDIAIITDCRFPDEVESIQGDGGLVVRLVRNIYNDQHESEVVLDSDKYDWDNFDYIFDNSEIGIVQSCLEFQEILKDIGIVKGE